MGLAALTLVLLLLPGSSLGGGAIGVAGGGHPHPSTPGAGIGAAALAAAGASLSRGAGPAHGFPTTCAAAASGVGTCAQTPGPVRPQLTVGPVWTNIAGIQPVWPTNRTLGAMVWDGVDHYVLLFGGCASASTCNGVELGDTWAFSDSHWTNLTPTLSSSPSGRAIPQIAYDAADQEVVLFGGLIGNAASLSASLNDTWTYAHGLWTNITTTIGKAPLPRYRGAMTYDAADGYVLLFGGTFSSATTVPYKDTWKFVNATWTNLTSTVTGSPPGRYRAAVAYDAADSEVVLFGGCLSSTNCPTSQTWTYAAGAWKNLTTTLTKAPAGRVYPAMTYDTRDGYVLLYGGSHTTTTGPIFGDTWKFVSNNWTNLTTLLKPSPLQAGQGMLAADGFDNLTLYFGGYNALGTTINGYGATWAYGPPIVGYATGAPARVDVGQSAVLNISAASDATPLGYAYSNLPSGCTNLNASRITCVANSVYSSAVLANVTDTRNDNLSFSVPLVVAPDPAIVYFRENLTNVTVGSPVHFTVNATGGTGAYRYAFHALPSGCSSVNADNLTCLPRAAGNFTIVAQVTDAASFSVQSIVNLTVNPAPSILAFTASVLTTDVGLPIVFRTNASGGTHPLHYLYSGLPAGCLTVSAPVLNCVPSAPSQAIVQVNVTDVFGWYATATATVTISPAVRIDSSAVSLPSVDAGTSFTLWVNASGGTAPLSYVYLGLPFGCSLNGTATGSCRPATPGNYSIVATVSDPVGGAATTFFNVTVVPDPSIATFTLSRGATDVGIATTISATVSNGTPSFTFSYHGLPSGCATNNTNVLLCTPGVTGHFTISVTVTDAFLKSATATAPLVVNPDVHITSFNATPAAVTVGQNSTFQISATGGTGVLTYSFSGLPNGCAAANVSSLPCDAQATGTFDVLVTVHDSVGSSAGSNTTFVVSAVPSSPPGLLGGSGSSGSLLIVAVAVVALAAIALLLLLRRRRPSKPAKAEPDPTPAAPEAWDER